MKRAILAGVVVAVIAGSAYAHHSFATYYFEERSVTIEGELAGLDYRNPHAWVYITANDEEGVPRRYSAEWSNTNRLSGDGVTKDTLKAGERVIVTGSPGRNPEEFKLHLKRIQRPADGWAWPGDRRRN